MTVSVRQVGRVILLLVAVALIVGTGLLTYSQWHSGRRPPVLLGKRVAVADARTVGPEPACPDELNGQPDNPTAELSLFIRSVDLHALTATVEAALCFPEALLLTLYTKKYGQTLHKAKQGYLSFDPHRKFGEAEVNVSYTREVPTAQVSDFVPGSTTIGPTVQLGRFVGANESPQASLGEFTLPLVAAPQEYPFDWYSLRDDFSVTIFYLDGEKDEEIVARPTKSDEPPVNVKVFGEPALSPLILTASTAKPPRELDHGASLTVRLERSATTRWYVTVIAWIPLLLAVLLCIVLLRANAAEGRIGLEAVAAVTAALLAVLPIRFVLVPAAVAELTLVDYWLGFEVAVLAAVACLAVRRTL